MKLNLFTLLVFLVSISSIQLKKISADVVTDYQALLDAQVNAFKNMIHNALGDTELEMKIFTERTDQIKERLFNHDINTITEKDYNMIKTDYDNMINELRKSTLAAYVNFDDMVFPAYKDRIEAFS